MQTQNSLPYMNLSRQVAGLERTVQSLVQYQRLLYMELLQVKRKLGMDDPTEPETMEQVPMPQTLSRGNRARTATQSVRNTDDVDISQIQRALNMQMPSRSSRPSRSTTLDMSSTQSTPSSSATINN